VFGEGRPFLVALIVPAAAGGLGESALIASEITRCLQHAAHEEQVRQFAILDRPFSHDRGELTPKLSLCRTVIAANFSQQIADLYTNMPPKFN
jgi:long-subunit acyl-CoA synthetase (AMP-forming)